MRWKWTAETQVVEASEAALEQAPSDRIRADLERRGLSPIVAERLSLRVEGRMGSQQGADYEALLDGVSLAAAAQEDATAEMSQQLRDLQEIERLMNGFSKELTKLDEVLEVLAAHVRKMRGNAPAPGERTLH